MTARRSGLGAAVAAILSPRAHVAAMLRFEAALARAEARAGLLSVAAAEQIEAACRVEHFDLEAIAVEAELAGTPAIPLVRRLTALVEGDGARHVHRGATSQDAIDSALVLQMREALDLIEAALAALAEQCAHLAESHRGALMPGRTLLQHALPITFGLKAARWLDLLSRQIAEVARLRESALVLQFGGAAGTLASLGSHGIAVADLLGDELELPVPDLPWHAERDRVSALAAGLGVLAGAAAKVAWDIVLLAQTEVGEVAEAAGPGKGVSSTLPQKRNPVDAIAALTSARLAVGQVPIMLGAMAPEHERGVGGWQAEWSALPALAIHAATALERVGRAVEGLEIDAARMRANLDLGGGMLMAESLGTALAVRVGRDEALRRVRALSERAVQQRATLQAAALADPDLVALLGESVIAAALDPAEYLGSADAFVDRALARHRAPARRPADSPLPPTSPICTACRHLDRGGGRPRCAAFRRGVPAAIWRGEHDHRTYVRGDGGFRFEAIDAVATDTEGAEVHA